MCNRLLIAQNAAELTPTYPSTVTHLTPAAGAAYETVFLVIGSETKQSYKASVT